MLAPIFMSAKNSVRQSKGMAEGGVWGGNSVAPKYSAGAPACRSLGAGGKLRRLIRVLHKMSSDVFQQTPPKNSRYKREFFKIMFLDLRGFRLRRLGFMVSRDSTS